MHISTSNPVVHAVTLSGNTTEMFRGFLVLARTVSGNRVGNFTPAANGQVACDVSICINVVNSQRDTERIFGGGGGFARYKSFWSAIV